MFLHVLRTWPGAITAVCLFGGLGLMVIGDRTLAVAGAALIFLAVLVPFLQLPTGREEPVKPEQGQSIEQREVSRSRTKSTERKRHTEVRGGG